jgi:hypothetical protein
MGSRARPATTDDMEELIRLAAVMLAGMGHDPSPESWQRTARQLLPGEFEADTKAALRLRL